MDQTFPTEEIIKSKAFTDFYKTALDFCLFIENLQPTTKVDFMQATRQHLLRLYTTALELQWVELQSNAEFDDRLHEADIKPLLNSISQRLEGSQYYWHVFDPTNEEDIKPVCGDLGDDLGDIYKDLKNAITIFNLEQSGCEESALWNFKFLFEKHWNDHCINALSAIHFYLDKSVHGSG